MPARSGGSGTVYTAAATDADSTGLSYSLSGADAALFAIDATSGAVTFVAAPDFETPADAGTNNVYDIVVTASDGTNTTDQSVAITVTVTVTDVIGDFVDLTSLTTTQGFIIQGDEAGDSAGVAVSSAGDVNGDGFDDLIVGAPRGDDGGSSAGEAYVVYGGATGTESTVALTQNGTAAADNFTGNAGNDSFAAIATDDVVRGGAGDDMVTITALDFAEVDGGHGTDTLALDGAGLSLDLTGARTDIEHFELVDLTGSGNNTLTLDSLSLLEISDRTAGGLTTFTVLGDAGDIVDLSADTGWTAGAQRTEDGTVFDVYLNGNAELLVEDAVTTNL